MTTKLYAERDHYQLSPQYERHLLAMTAEGLDSKSAIAAELAHRDIEIERLRAALERIASPHKEWMNITEAAAIAREALAGSVHEPKPDYRNWPREPPHCPSCDCGSEPKAKCTCDVNPWCPIHGSEKSTRPLKNE